MMLSIFQSGLFAPFAEYPLTRRYETRTLPPIIFLACLVILALLATFNILTQGTTPVSSSVLLEQYLSNSRVDKNTTDCQPALLRVGNGLFSSAVNSTRDPGSFKWTVNSLVGEDADPSSVQVPYHGESLSCNMSSHGLTYYFTEQSFKYGMCATCQAVNPMNDSTFVMSGASLASTYIDLCTNYDLSSDNWPVFTSPTQGLVQAQIYLMAKIYQNLTFQPGTIPDVVFPLYNATVHNPLSDILIEPKDVRQMSAWFGGFNYTGRARGLAPKICEPHKVCAQGTYHIGNLTFDDTPPILNATGWHSGVMLAVSGMGNLQPALAFGGNVSQLPGAFPNMFNYTFGIVSYMLDTALQDLDDRSLGVTYLCTVSSRAWKPPMTLLAVVLGNSLGMLGAALACMVFLARRFDRSRSHNTSFEGQASRHQLHAIHRSYSNDSRLNPDFEEASSPTLSYNAASPERLLYKSVSAKDGFI